MTANPTFGSAVVHWAAQNFRSLSAALRWLRAHEVRVDKPLFASADAALRWAYRTQPSAVKMSSVSKFMGRYSREDDDDQAVPPSADPGLERKPTGLEAAAQIGMIKGFVNRLPTRERHYLIGRYAIGRERQYARAVLGDALLPVLSGAIRPPRIVYQLVCRHYGRRVVFHALAQRILYLFPEMPEPKRSRHVYRLVRRMSGDIDRALRDIGGSADVVAHQYFHDQGVIK